MKLRRIVTTSGTEPVIWRTCHRCGGVNSPRWGVYAADWSTVTEWHGISPEIVLCLRCFKELSLVVPDPVPASGPHTG